MLTKGAMGNLVNRYKAVLKKCHLINVFGSLAVASALIFGCAGVAEAARCADVSEGETLELDGETICGYRNVEGGAISSSGELIVRNSKFTDNTVDMAGNDYDGGGAILSNRGTTTNYNSEFAYNHTEKKEGHGHAVTQAGGTLCVYDSTFKNNAIAQTTNNYDASNMCYADIVLVEGEPIRAVYPYTSADLDNVYINHLEVNGVVAGTENASLTIDGCMFEGNATKRGILSLENSEATVKDTTFTENYSNYMVAASICATKASSLSKAKIPSIAIPLQATVPPSVLNGRMPIPSRNS